ncbi:hypothetical protein K469DRAFT_389097 [Zopfia rhizophila CBS 207.26]|uniref:Uncharacterized protein n=1 Tax=Zopfia rhizophila CBS 207.26 TaxID=1314779 RepID=A0A6A6EHN7_9PEZI|nr:hypothetical protein K469DRAFT_389097 [Zopfia rhizophila CBS 207.26]
MDTWYVQWHSWTSPTVLIHLLPSTSSCQTARAPCQAESATHGMGFCFMFSQPWLSISPRPRSYNSCYGCGLVLVFDALLFHHLHPSLTTTTQLFAPIT